jgi:hypothetical protein
MMWRSGGGECSPAAIAKHLGSPGAAFTGCWAMERQYVRAASSDPAMGTHVRKAHPLHAGPAEVRLFAVQPVEQVFKCCDAIELQIRA